MYAFGMDIPFAAASNVPWSKWLHRDKRDRGCLRSGTTLFSPEPRRTRSLLARSLWPRTAVARYAYVALRDLENKNQKSALHQRKFNIFVLNVVREYTSEHQGQRTHIICPSPRPSGTSRVAQAKTPQAGQKPRA